MMTIADIVGDNQVHQITLPAPAMWVQFAVTGAGIARVGGVANGSIVSANQGIPVSAGPNVGFMAPFRGQYVFYQPDAFQAYVPNGATLSVGAQE